MYSKNIPAPNCLSSNCCTIIYVFTPKTMLWSFRLGHCYKCKLTFERLPYFVNICSVKKEFPEISFSVFASLIFKHFDNMKRTRKNAVMFILFWNKNKMTNPCGNNPLSQHGALAVACLLIFFTFSHHK